MTATFGAPAPLPPDLGAALACARSRLGIFGANVLFYPETVSTNDAAAAIGVEGTLVLAGRQTAGRGRRGHTWFSPPGTGIYASVVLRPSRARIDPARATLLLTIAAGVALADGIEASTGLRADLKWPNDLYASRRKLGGILAEASTDAVVLGYGVNVNAEAYPADIADRATSLEVELGRPVDSSTVIVETVAALARRYDDLIEGRYDAILDAWRGRAPDARGATVTWSTPGRTHVGTTAGIDDHGALLVQVGERVDRIVGGEVTWVSV